MPRVASYDDEVMYDNSVDYHAAIERLGRDLIVTSTKTKARCFVCATDSYVAGHGIVSKWLRCRQARPEELIRADLEAIDDDVSIVEVCGYIARFDVCMAGCGGKVSVKGERAQP